jgi:hypothetical protein
VRVRVRVHVRVRVRVRVRARVRVHGFVSISHGLPERESTEFVATMLRTTSSTMSMFFSKSDDCCSILCNCMSCVTCHAISKGNDTKNY